MSRSQHHNKRGGRALVVVLIVLVSVVVLALASGVTAVVATTSFANGDKIAPGVRLGGVTVAGMTQVEAQSALEREYLPKLPAQMDLAYPGGKISLTREELGVQPQLDAAIASAMQAGREADLLARLRSQWALRRGGVDIPIGSTVDESRLGQALAGLAPQINRQPKNAKISVSGDNQLQKSPGQTGVTLLVPASVKKVAAALAQDPAVSVDLVVKQQPPNISEKDLAGLTKVLSSYETPYHTYQRDRTHNMEIAMGRINGTVLQPGQEFSVNGCVGERTVKDGFRSAPIFKDGKVVPDTGGGVCQVASTLYNMALLANLQVTQRDHHSRPVWYCPTGRDAAVYWGSKDLKFKNSLPHPVVILGEIRGDHLWAACVGSVEDDYDVELIRSHTATLGYGTTTRQDPSQPVGYRKVDNPGNVGARATLSVKISKDGKLIKSEKLHDDHYSPVTRVVIVGSKPKKPAAGLTPPGAQVPPGAPGAHAPGPGMTPDTPATGSATRPASAATPPAHAKPVKPAKPAKPSPKPAAVTPPAATTPHRAPTRLPD